ncbi:MAG: hypothetical protein DWQ44_05000 [Bacteroidetes bacterium]|nr:MAG: hypothetical protein DWQ33_11645 [Bacteroidota bacterium]REK00736.1 MAG: hypothetical protein DWQ39_11320 [Bacteroidota bacterium]REK34984.1 MAG: hypothetical protein DWQ44_05000 [Bacteroidota bacterium]REK48219.1 MAG: hypothetical protein DWQ48_10345 [Bacteroidota bacterium]
MCTLTYFPKGQGDYIITSNRDESPLRKPAAAPALYKIGDASVLFPKDLEANGTWIATSGSFTVCLMNGAFAPHEREESYRKSRGLVLLDFFKFRNADKFLDEYDFSGIEPFTMIIAESSAEVFLYEARWDGNKIHKGTTDSHSPQIWSSASLYTQDVIEERQQWFNKFLKSHWEYNRSEIMDFHYFGGKGNTETALLMNRENKVRTVSITCVEKRGNRVIMTYRDVLKSSVFEEQFVF